MELYLIELLSIVLILNNTEGYLIFLNIVI